MEDQKYMSTTEAMEVASVSRITIIDWCHKYGIGDKIVGRWRVDKKKFMELISKREKEKIYGDTKEEEGN